MEPRVGSDMDADQRDEAFWRDFLASPDTMMSVGRVVFNRLPNSPRCHLCASPFSGWGGRVMQHIGKRPSDGNPNVCNSCQRILVKHHGGAEVDSTMLFADIRGSTTLGEQLAPREFRAVLDRFYEAAATAVFDNGGIVDKFVGDELVAAFPPTFGEDHAARAIAAARDALVATGHTRSEGPWAPVGAGVHTGRLWFGVVGEGSHVELTMVGDVVNTTARLAGVAERGEILVSTEAAAAAGLDRSLPRRSFQLKGKSGTTSTVAIRVGPAGAGSATC